MSMIITVPCNECKPEAVPGDPPAQSPQRRINGGRLIGEDETDANFELNLSCGHTIEFTFSQEEKPDVIAFLDPPTPDEEEQV